MAGIGIYTCCKCGRRRECWFRKLTLQFSVNTHVRSARLCVTCNATIAVGDRLQRGCLSYGNFNPPTVAKINEQFSDKLSAAQKKRIERDIEAKRHASEQERNERRDRVLYLRRFSPQNRKWLKGFTLATVRGMEVYPRRRRPQTDDEATFLRNLTNDDVTGWLVYADWLDDNAAGGGTSGKGLLSDQIRYEASRAERTR